MSAVWQGATAIARMGWLQMYNRGWRFSPRKSLALGLLSELGVIFWISQRTGLAMGQLGSGTGALSGLLALLALQMGWFGLMYGFGRGQFQLYTGILVPLYQITPARPISLILGRVLEALPRRAYSTTLWAWAYAQALPPGDRGWGVLVLAATGIAVSMLTHLSGLLAVTLWSFFSPRSLRRGLFVVFAITLAGVTWAVLYLSGGGSFLGLAQAMRLARWYIFGAMAVLGGLPGLSLLVAFVFRPAAVENLYQVSLYKVLEVADNEDIRPARSYWLPLPDGPLRAVVSREWLALVRSGGTRFRLAVWLAGVVTVWVAAPSAAGFGSERVLLVVAPLALTTWWLAFGNLVIGAFVGERFTLPLYRLTGTPAAPVLIGKLAGHLVPALALGGLAMLVGGWRAGLDAAGLAHVLFWTAAGLLAGVAATVGVAAATVPDDEDEEATAAASATGGMPGAGGGAGGGMFTWALARTLALAGPLVIATWTGAGTQAPRLQVPSELGLAVLAVWAAIGLAVGWWSLRRNWTAGPGAAGRRRRTRPRSRTATTS